MAELSRDVCALIQNEIALDPDVVVANDTELLLSGLVDSLGVVQIVAWLEDRFAMQIDPADVVFENFETPGRIVEFVAGLQPTSL